MALWRVARGAVGRSHMRGEAARRRSRAVLAGGHTREKSGGGMSGFVQELSQLQYALHRIDQERVQEKKIVRKCHRELLSSFATTVVAILPSSSANGF